MLVHAGREAPPRQGTAGGMQGLARPAEPVLRAQGVRGVGGRLFDPGAGVFFDASAIGTAPSIVFDDGRGGTDTVSGIEKLNRTVAGLNAQFVQMQALQGASLIGREVIVPGNKLVIENGTAEAGFELNTAADSVKVEVLGPSGHVLDTLNLGAQAAGAHNFTWNAGSNATATGVTFRVTAMSGSTKLDSTPLMHDTVSAINTSGDSLTLELKNSGNVAYSQVKAFN